jgi:hypothetical protein
MAKAKKRAAARKGTTKSVKANLKRRATAKRAAPKAKSKLRRARKPVVAKRPKPVERKETVPEAPVEMTIVAVEQPAPGVLVVEEVVVREESADAAGSADAGSDLIDQSEQKVA